MEANQTTAKTTLGKQYRPSEHEERIWSLWERSGSFRADPGRVVREGAPAYAVLIPPPNVTAALHLGHALNNTLQDVLVRAHRMKGFETLWMPGTDHAGIATQTVVEKRLLAEEGRRRTDYGREEFVARVQAWKDEYEARITDQLKRVGCSCDWDRRRFTMDDVCARAVREAFFRLFRDGLIYRGKRLVNWDPVTQTALADDEVDMLEIDGHFYYIRYPLIHPSPSGDHDPVTWGELAARGYPGADDHPDDDQAWLTVATTRPETYLGDSGVAVNPADPRAPSLRGLLVELPLVGRKIPIIEDDYVVMPAREGDESADPKARFATGFLKVTPAHDPNDYEIGRRHALDVINVMAPDASISDEHGWTDIGDAHILVGLSREDARKKIVREFQAHSLNSQPLLEDIRPYRHSVGHSYRSGVPVEPYMSDQWYVRVTDDRLRGVAQRALRPEQRSEASLRAWPESAPTPGGLADGDGSMTFHPDRYARTYESWHDNLRDWCISRQLWWGHRIPVWTRTVEPGDDRFPEITGVLERWAGEDRACATIDGRPLTAETGAPRETADAEIRVCLRDADDREATARLERYGFAQDEDVLDTWFSSALWPLSTLGWPDTERAAADTGIDDFSDLLGAFNPTSVLCTAREIITLWVSRMVMFNRCFLADRAAGPVPFRDVFIHAMIQDGEGRKMSKSLGNGVDPLDIVESHGADAMRFTLTQMTTHTQDVRMPVELDPESGRNTSPKFDGGRNFCNKLWNAARFAIGLLDKHPAPGQTVSGEDLSLPDRWILSRLARTAMEVDRALETYRFNEYAGAAYDLLWRDFCDWYLEAIKPTAGEHTGQRATLRYTLDAVLRLLHPIVPFITEAIHEPVRALPPATIEGAGFAPDRDPAALTTSGWPTLEAALLDERAEAEFERVRTLVSAVREVRAQHQVNPKRRVTLHTTPELAREIAGAGGLVETLAGIASVSTDAPAGPAVAFTHGAVEHRLADLADAVDASAERTRLTRRLEQLDKSIQGLRGRLKNPGYLDKAPTHLVDQTRAELTRAEADREATAAALESLG